MFVTNWISTTKIQKISEITNFFRHYFLSRTEVDDYIKLVHMKAALGYGYDCIGLRIWLHRVTDMAASGYRYGCIGLQILLRKLTETYL